MGAGEIVGWDDVEIDPDGMAVKARREMEARFANEMEARFANRRSRG